MDIFKYFDFYGKFKYAHIIIIHARPEITKGAQYFSTSNVSHVNERECSNMYILNIFKNRCKKVT